MGEFLKYFVPAFLLFLCVGAVAGWQKRSEVAKDAIYANLTITEHQGRYYLDLACRQFRFDVGADRGELYGDVGSRLAFHETVLGTPSERHLEIAGLVGTFLGGTTGGIVLKDIAAKVSAPEKLWTWTRIRQTIYGIIGGITGYAAGYWFASNFDTDCTSDLVPPLLRDTKLWQRFETQYFLATLKELETLEGAIITGEKLVNQTAWRADPLYSCPTRLKWISDQLEDFLSKPEADPGSGEFARLAKLRDVHMQAQNWAVHRWLLDNAIFRFSPTSIPEAIRGGYTRELWDKNCEKLDALVGSVVAGA